MTNRCPRCSCSHPHPPTQPPTTQAMFVDFGMAAQYGGNCYLRFDDTNPEAEKQEYIDHILVSVCIPMVYSVRGMEGTGFYLSCP